MRPFPAVARDTLITSVWMGVRILALVVWLWALLSALPASDLGWLTSLLALSSVGVLLVQAGIPYLFFEDSHTGERLHDSLRQAGGAILIGAPIISLGATAILFGIEAEGVMPWHVLYAVFCLDISASATVQALALLGHSRGKMAAAAGLPAMLMVVRALSAVAATMLAFSLEIEPVISYLMLHLSLTAVFAIGVLARFAIFGVVVKPLLPRRETLLRSWRYGLMGGSSLALGELDKPLVSRSFGFESAGYYAIAYRFASTAATPATAFAASMIPRWAGMHSRGERRNLVVTYYRAWLAAAIGGVAIGWLMIEGMALIPVGAFGLYPELWNWVPALAALVPLIGLHQLTSAALLATGRPLARTSIDVGAYLVLVVAVVANTQEAMLWAVPLACMLAEVVAVIAGAALLVASAMRDNAREVQ